MTEEEAATPDLLPAGSRVFRPNPLTSQAIGGSTAFDYTFKGVVYRPGRGSWKTNLEGLKRLEKANRLVAQGKTLGFIRYLDDFPFRPINNVWDDTRQSGFAAEKLYVVQTSTKVVERCMLMTTEPGDIVLDPTCGSGTTAYVAEQWGRRWVIIDTSRVPLALTRQRLLTATFPYYELRDEKHGPASGFVYRRKQNRKGEEVGGVVPHVTLKSIANNEPADEELLVDRPEVKDDIVRVTGAFAVEATIPAPADVDAPDAALGEGDIPGTVLDTAAGYLPRMLDALKHSPLLRLPGGQAVELKNIRPPTRALDLHAIADVEAGKERQTVAIVFGPENGAVTEQLIVRAVKEANAKNYEQLFVIGFTIQDAASRLLKKSEDALGMKVTYAQATLDILMGDLLKDTRASQLFSIIGLPDIKLRKLKKKGPDGDALYQVKLIAIDTYDPVKGEPDTLKGEDVPCWMLDSDYDELVFRANQVFFPRTGAWDNLKRELKGVFNDSLWDHLAGTESEPFAAGERGRVSVKVIDERGNELMVVKDLKEAEGE